MKRFLLISLLLGNILFRTYAQEKDTIRNLSFSAQYSYGFILAHHKFFKYLIKAYVPSFELNSEFQTKGTKIWHQLYNYPTLGFGYCHINFGNPEVLGHADAIFPYIQIPLTENPRFSLNTKFSVGVAWLNKKFNLYNNMYNIAIGSKLNAYLSLSLGSEIRITKHLFAITGFGISHYSNGGSTQPNRGINIIAVRAGVKYLIHQNELKSKINPLPKFNKKNEFSLILAGGIKTLEPARSQHYMVSIFSFNAERQYSYKGRYGIGIDLFKDNSRKIYLPKIEGYVEVRTSDLFYAGGHLSYDLVFGKTSFTLQMGGYFFNRAKFFQYVYHRFGIKYRFADHWMANVTLKTFWAAADFAEFGIGYRF